MLIFIESITKKKHENQPEQDENTELGKIEQQHIVQISGEML